MALENMNVKINYLTVSDDDLWFYRYNYEDIQENFIELLQSMSWSEDYVFGTTVTSVLWL